MHDCGGAHICAVNVPCFGCDAVRLEGRGNFVEIFPLRSCVAGRSTASVRYFHGMKVLLAISTETGASPLMYTVVFDTVNEIIMTAGGDQAKSLEAANEVVNRYLEGGIKIRKKPAPRAKTTKTPAKEKQVDALTAASRKVKSMASNVFWMQHPEDPDYPYTPSIRLSKNGFPVRNNHTKKAFNVWLLRTGNPFIESLMLGVYG
jgi:ribosomal protein L16/L10AE